MDNYIVILAIVGAAALAMAWMPAITQKLKISYAVLYVVLGFVLYTFVRSLPEPNPTKQVNITLRLTELVVLVSLMGTGLKIDERFSFKDWSIPLRLVSITMLLSILITALLGYFWLGFSIPSAILLGAALAPTDPVLASDVQVGPPLEKARSNVRFALTAEGGLNDSMAFPFTWLAIALTASTFDAYTLTHWVVMDIVVKLGVGLVSGFLIGKALAYLLFHLPKKTSLTTPADGFVALSATLLVYGVTELLHGYGFLAVFVCAVTLRNFEMHHQYHKKLHAFSDQIERILVAIVLILFGGSIAYGILSILSWPLALFGLVSILIVRPLCAYFSVMRTKLPGTEKAMISFFGIKGVGSLFYLSFALNEATFENAAELWCVVSFIVLCSILIHGFSAAKTIAHVENNP
ncbi:cation:proton antiporter [Parachryseolinea silvisoli]|uniref:cation:proton antiporter n=1 Tax=Parachryseolinea silvisoli TaxID=2873601 RepID=UPI002265ABCA|nr:cation:proton antiporter [Parachryseolinea silvisoli]MCD9015452.1 cation:proton antiporter [Parachryseolinea silvisoli]